MIHTFVHVHWVYWFIINQDIYRFIIWAIYFMSVFISINTDADTEYVLYRGHSPIGFWAGLAITWQSLSCEAIGRTRMQAWNGCVRQACFLSCWRSWACWALRLILEKQIRVALSMQGAGKPLPESKGRSGTRIVPQSPRDGGTLNLIAA